MDHRLLFGVAARQPGRRFIAVLLADCELQDTLRRLKRGEEVADQVERVAVTDVAGSLAAPGDGSAMTL